MPTSPKLSLDELVESQAGGETTFNDAVHGLEAFAVGKAKSVLITAAEPGSPEDGDVYVLPSDGVTGTNWLGEDGKVAVYNPDASIAGGWVFYTPLEGMRFLDVGTKIHYVYDGTRWVPDSRTHIAPVDDIIEADLATAPPNTASGIRYILLDTSGTPHLNWGTIASQGVDDGDVVESDGQDWFVAIDVSAQGVLGQTAYVKDSVYQRQCRWDGTGWRPVGSYYGHVSSDPIGTAAETTRATRTVKYLQAGDLIRVRARGDAVWVSAGTHTYTIRIRVDGLSGPVIASVTGTVQSGKTPAYWFLEADFIVANIHASSGSMVTLGSKYGTGLGSTVNPSVELNPSDATGLDTTGDLDIVLTTEHTGSNGEATTELSYSTWEHNRING